MEFSGGVAVITGAAGGIGYALAAEAARRGMKVVLSDIRQAALDEAAGALAATGATVLAHAADVTQPEQVEALAAAADRKFGKVNLLVNNAGAFVAGLAWETPAAQYDWVIDLNLKSVAHGIRAFVPRMIAQGDPCHVVTVASAAAITVYPGYASYSATKHAALALTEALRLDLAAEGIGNIGVTIAMPGVVRSSIMSPELASPPALGLERRDRFANRTVRAMERMMAKHTTGGAMAAEVLAGQVFEAVADGRLYVLPNHDAPAQQAVATMIGTGRATGVDPYPPVLESIMRSLAKADETPG